MICFFVNLDSTDKRILYASELDFTFVAKEASNNVSRIIFKVELIFVPKHECKITTLFCGSLCDSITIVFSSGILPKSKLVIMSFAILIEPLRTLVLKFPTLFAVLKSTGMFTPSHLGTGIS